MLPNCSCTLQNMEVGRWPKEALRFSIRGKCLQSPNAVDWCGNAQSTEQIRHTLNIAKVTAGKGSTSLM
jgi:hypothetical protein